MRDRDEIQRAHDLLIGFLLHAQEDPDESINIAASTLCWVLQHDHNPYFAQALEDLQHHATLIYDAGC